MTATQRHVPQEPATGDGCQPARPPFARWPVGIVTGLVGVLLLATNGGYGYHRDELYFLLLRPAWGYRDQPPLTPLLAQATDALFGGSLWALRAPATLFVVAAVLLAALLARELGGGALAQGLAAAGFGTGAATLIFGHVLLTATLDLVVWLAVILFVTRALLRDQPRWWLAAGAVVGFGLYNKLLVVLLLATLGIGLLATGPRRVLLDRWLWAGVALALVIGAPNLVYQLTHDLPQAQMASGLAEDNADARTLFVPFQLILIGPPLVAIWAAGLVGLLRRPLWRPVRSLGVAYLAACVIVLASGGQFYYTYGILGALFAAGAVVTADWAGRGRRPVRLAVTGVALGLNAVVTALIALPLVPVDALGDTPIPGINQTAQDSVGWPVYVDQVVQAYDTLPAADRARAVVLTGNYGEAGALHRFGADRLAKIYSGHNELWYYGPPADSATVLLSVGVGEPGELSEFFGSCELAGRLDNGVGVDNEEQDQPIVICRDPRQPWHQLWPRMQHDN
jgi:hypothetical protein